MRLRRSEGGMKRLEKSAGSLRAANSQVDGGARGRHDERKVQELTASSFRIEHARDVSEEVVTDDELQFSSVRCPVDASGATRQARE